MSAPSELIPPALAWGIIGTLAIAWVLLGIWLGKKSTSLTGYALAGRNVGLAFGAATAVATWITSNTTLLAPQFALQLGMWGMLAYSTASFGLLLFAPLARRIQELMPNGFTSGDFIRLRYGKPAWALFMFISAFYALTWLISMGMAGGILLKSVAGIPYFVGMSIVLWTCVLYTLFGGLYAVIGTDFFQTVIILIGVLVIGVILIVKIDISTIYDSVSTFRPALLWIMFPSALMAVFNNLLFGLGEIFHSNVWWSRAFAIRKGLGFKAYALAGLFWLPVPIAAGFIALAAGALNVPIPSPDMVGPLVTVKLLGQVGAILVLIIVFCSLASSIDSLLAATSDMLANDVFKRWLRPDASDQQVRRMMSIITVSLGVFSWLLCALEMATLAEVLFFAGPLVGSTIWPIATGLFWRRATQAGAIGGMFLGSMAGLVAYFTIGWFVASLIGTVVSMVVVLICTKMSKESFDWRQLDEPHAAGVS